ncbi:MAG: hypothetical protein Q8Q03_03290 [bacterium]|nr:hypothetical protein [bacterium]
MKKQIAGMPILRIVPGSESLILDSDPRIIVSVYVVVIEAEPLAIFSSFGRPLEKTCLPKERQEEFFEKHRLHLHPRGWANLFLFEENNKLFITIAYNTSPRLITRKVVPITWSHRIDRKSAVRVIVPKQ